MYTIKQAAARSGVGVSLLRAWERRYGIVHPVRTPSGYRLYDEDSIARLRAMRRLVETGWSPSQAAAAILDEGEQRALAGVAPLTTEERAEPPILGADEGAGLAGAFVLAATRYDAAGLERALDEMFGRGSVEAVLDEQLMPAVRALGDEWAAGRLDIAEEHLASSAVVRRLSALFDLAGSRGQGPRVLVGLPPGGRHEIGAMGFAVALRRRGLDVLYLGADVPVDSWIKAIAESGARAAVIGVQRAADGERAREVAFAIRAAHPQVAVALGGPSAATAAIDLSAEALPGRLVDAIDTIVARLAG